MPLDQKIRQEIREAFFSGQLRVQTVNPSSGDVIIHPITAVLRHHTPTKPLVKITLVGGSGVTTTVDHSLFYKEGNGIHACKASALRVGDSIVVIRDGVSSLGVVGFIDPKPPCDFTYDLSVPGPQNFMLSNGILAHNSYSIGGVSLDIDRSSKYESLKSNAESQFDKATEAKARTVKFIRGLQQQKYGIGIRSAFGPQVGRGVLSPRNFL